MQADVGETTCALRKSANGEKWPANEAQTFPCPQQQVWERETETTQSDMCYFELYHEVRVTGGDQLATGCAALDIATWFPTWIDVLVRCLHPAWCAERAKKFGFSASGCEREKTARYGDAVQTMVLETSGSSRKERVRFIKYLVTTSVAIGQCSPLSCARRRTQSQRVLLSAEAAR